MVACGEGEGTCESPGELVGDVGERDQGGDGLVGVVAVEAVQVGASWLVRSRLRCNSSVSRCSIAA